MDGKTRSELNTKEKLTKLNYQSIDNNGLHQNQKQNFNGIENFQIDNTNIKMSDGNFINECSNDRMKDEYDSSDSVETAADEIPVWIHGEKRWISGVNEETTCADLINVLLADEGINLATECDNASHFVITERWRRVEQILDDDTKIKQIWSAWGQAKAEVKLTLCQLGGESIAAATNAVINHHRSSKSNTATNGRSHRQQADTDGKDHQDDSGMGSPNGSTTNSAIIRRRRHRAAKSSSAWVTHGQTIHPKSQKATIEKLVKLILEQGETIQQQLAKLRDREFEIANIEDERHKVREREHGKNYLLETYLNGLHEAATNSAGEEKDLITATSDSGVHTEGASASSPEITRSSCLQGDLDIIDYDKDDSDQHHEQPHNNYNRQSTYATTNANNSRKEKSHHQHSHREQHLLEEHQHTKEFSSRLTESLPGQERDVEDISSKIEWMEKLIVINKHLQREEELLVRLGAKIRKYESQDPALNEQQITEALARVNAGIDSSGGEIQRIENELLVSQNALQEKKFLLEQLNQELLSIPITTASTNDERNKELLKPPPEFENSEPCKKENLPNPSNNGDIAGNLYNFSQFIAKPNYDFNQVNAMNGMPLYATVQKSHNTNSCGRERKALKNNGSSTTSSSSAAVVKGGILKSRASNVVASSGIAVGNTPENCAPQATSILNSLNAFHKTEASNLNANVYSKSSAGTYNLNCKLGPKQLINGICHEIESNSDTGVSSLEDDIVHLGTLV